MFSRWLCIDCLLNNWNLVDQFSKLLSNITWSFSFESSWNHIPKQSPICYCSRTLNCFDALPKFLIRPTWESMYVELRKVRTWGLFPTSEGRARSLEIRLGRGTIMLLHGPASKTNTSWLELILHPFGVGTSHGRPWTHLTHHSPDLREATTFPHIVFSALLHGSHIWIALFPGTPKEESRNCFELDSWDFGNSYLLAPTSDWNEV
jgi:hypothetical protein